MNKIVYRKGDLFEGIKSFKNKIVIPHVVNIRNKMGSGFVIPLAKHFPEAKASYHSFCARFDEPADLFGRVDLAECSETIKVANMFAQDLGGNRPLQYNYLSQCMEFVAHRTYFSEATIVAPKFGAGLAGGNWNFIHDLIYDCWIRRGIPVFIYEL